MLLLLSLTALASPLDVDALADHRVVDASLDRLTGTPAGRAHLDASLDRLEDHERVVLRALRAWDVPDALAAIPVVESGYRNLDASHNPVGAAGLWQFIPSTARAYGLKVDDRVDERLDVRRASDAAARLLADLYDRYEDWGLVLSAYNQGPSRVDRAIAEHRTRDVWTLIERGALAPYPADVVAVMTALPE